MGVRNETVRVLETADALDVEIDARPGRQVVVGLGVWLALWLAVEWLLLGRIFLHPSTAADPFAVVLLCYWTAGGVLVARRAVARLKRRELIRVTGSHLHYRREYRWFRRTARFERAEVRNLHPVPAIELDPVRSRHADFWSWAGVGIEFEYRGALYRIASQLDRRDSERLAARIAARLGSLKR